MGTTLSNMLKSHKALPVRRILCSGYGSHCFFPREASLTFCYDNAMDLASGTTTPQQ